MSRLAVQLARLDVTLRRPLRTASGEVLTCHGVRVRVAGDGLVGWGEAMPVPGRGRETVERVEGLLGPFKSGWLQAPGSLADVEAQLEALPADAPAARYGLELALLDWLSRRREVPLAHLLSSTARAEVRVNALIDGDSPESLADAAAQAVAEGFETVKLKVATHPLDRDVARVEAVRARVGPGIRIRVDANGGWGEVLARRALAALGALDVELCEQPVPEGERAAMERLAARGGCRVAADESVPGLWAAGTLDGAARTAVRVWVLKPAALGGLLACVRIATAARAQGVETYVTAGWEGAVARCGAVHLAAAVGTSDRAHGLATGAWVLPPESAPFPENGVLRITSEPGLGAGGVP